MSRRQRHPQCCMLDLVDCFQDFVQKSLIFISLVVCSVAALLIYAVKLMLDKNRATANRANVQNRINTNNSNCPPRTPPPVTQSIRSTASSRPTASATQPPICHEVHSLLTQHIEVSKNIEECKKAKEEANKECITESEKKNEDECLNKDNDSCDESKPDKDTCKDDPNLKKKLSKKAKDSREDGSNKKKKPKKDKDSCNENSSQKKRQSKKDKDACDENSNQKSKSWIKSINPCKKNSASNKCKNLSDDDICETNSTSSNCRDSCGQDSSQTKTSSFIKSQVSKKDKDSGEVISLCCLQRRLSMKDIDLCNECSNQKNQSSNKLVELCDADQKRKSSNHCLDASDEKLLDKLKTLCPTDSKIKYRNLKKKQSKKDIKEQEVCLTKRPSIKNANSHQSLQQGLHDYECSLNVEKESDPSACPDSSTLTPIVIIHNLDP